MKMFLVYDPDYECKPQRINASSAVDAANIYAKDLVENGEGFAYEVVVTTQGDVGEGDGEVFEIQWTPKAVRR